MQRYLDGDILDPSFDITAEMDDLQAFYCRTAKRLVIAYELQRDNSDYQDDFLMALRDFLLVFETSLTIKSVEIADENSYAIKKNNDTGKIKGIEGNVNLDLAIVNYTKATLDNHYNGY